MEMVLLKPSLGRVNYVPNMEIADNVCLFSSLEVSIVEVALPGSSLRRVIYVSNMEMVLPKSSLGRVYCVSDSTGC